ncbi:MAG: nicotinic acid mononucleotide adenylyltransferase [Alphaproteobacteria bacterium]|nr:nicotinic acid mononucleotide adenylyltransferase [Alphaproteobacteria bacterium]
MPTLQNFKSLCPRQKAGAIGQAGTIGLLMGSFNPAHHGHLHISNVARKQLHLNHIWWLITPHNPLKDKHDLQPLASRISAAQKIAHNHDIQIAAPEQIFANHYSVQTILYLQRAFPNNRFILLMGSDNLYQLPQWYQAKKLLKLIQIAVIRRPLQHYPALLRFRKQLKHSARNSHHGLIAINSNINHISATSIRQHT